MSLGSQSSSYTPTAENVIVKSYTFDGLLYDLEGCLYVAEKLRDLMHWHGFDNVEHTVEDLTNFPVAAIPPTNLATLITYISDLMTAYIAHNADALLGAVWAFHQAQQLGNELASIVPPTNLAECITRMNDLRAKFNAHDSSAVSHTTGSVYPCTDCARKLFNITGTVEASLIGRCITALPWSADEFSIGTPLWVTSISGIYEAGMIGAGYIFAGWGFPGSTAPSYDLTAPFGWPLLVPAPMPVYTTESYIMLYSNSNINSGEVVLYLKYNPISSDGQVSDVGY